MSDRPEAAQGGLCRDCPISCRRPQKAKKNKQAAYAALWGLDQRAFGFANFVAAYHERCDDIGLEAFETAAAIALGLEAGKVKADFGGVLEALEEISRGTDLGLILGNGAESARLAFRLAQPRRIGPRKSGGHSEAEDIFLDSTGLCAFAYSLMPENPALWEALDSLLKAKYGPSFDGDNLKRLWLAAGGKVMSK